MEYIESIRVKFEKWPSILPIRLRTDIGGPLKSLRGASAKRYFKLEHDWEIYLELPDDRYPKEMSGTVVILRSYESEAAPSNEAETRLDGASVPFPWLVSFLSFGVLRPLGVMFIASIVHDFAFKHGGLVYRDHSGKLEFYKIQRHLVDNLFYDIIRTVNEMPFTALLAWAAVRLGWFWVKYGRKRFGKPFPFLAVIALVLLLLILGTAIISYGIEIVVLSLGAVYVLIFVLLQLIAPSNLEEVTE